MCKNVKLYSSAQCGLWVKSIQVDFVKVLCLSLMFIEQFIGITHNEKGLAFVGELVFRLPITKAQ